MPASPRTRSALGEVLHAAVLFAAAAAAGFAILVALFKAGVAGGMDILFYRGVVLCAAAFALTVLLVALLGRATSRASLRDAIAAGCLSLGLNLSVLVIAPVTVDRSLSVFILGHMAAHGGAPLSVHQIENAFQELYVGRLGQVQRRMSEQERSGNVRRAGDGYVITPQGRTFIVWAKLIGWLFDADPRLLDPDAPSPPAPHVLSGEPMPGT